MFRYDLWGDVNNLSTKQDRKYEHMTEGVVPVLLELDKTLREI